MMAQINDNAQRMASLCFLISLLEIKKVAVCKHSVLCFVCACLLQPHIISFIIVLFIQFIAVTIFYILDPDFFTRP